MEEGDYCEDCGQFVASDGACWCEDDDDGELDEPQ